MSSLVWIGGAVSGLAALLLAAQVLRSWIGLRGKRAVTCPETGRKVGVELDARHAALGAVFSGPAQRLSSCTRWPERQGCGQECLREIAQAGAGCLVRSIVTGWYAGRRCFYCGSEVGEIDWASRKPALLSPAGASIAWEQIEIEHIDEVLASHRPVCFACHVANTFAAQHPDLIVDRTVPRA